MLYESNKGFVKMTETKRIPIEKTLLWHVLKYCWNAPDETCDNCFGWKICKQIPDSLWNDIKDYEDLGFIKVNENGVHSDIMESEFVRILKHCYTDTEVECCDCPNDAKCAIFKKKLSKRFDTFLIVLKNRGFLEEFKVDTDALKKQINEILEGAITKVKRMLDDMV